jgi:hypothetical protein
VEVASIAYAADSVSGERGGQGKGLPCCLALAPPLRQGQLHAMHPAAFPALKQLGLAAPGTVVCSCGMRHGSLTIQVLLLLLLCRCMPSPPSALLCVLRAAT